MDTLDKALARDKATEHRVARMLREWDNADNPTIECQTEHNDAFCCMWDHGDRCPETGPSCEECETGACRTYPIKPDMMAEIRTILAEQDN